MKLKVLQIFQDFENPNKFHCPGEVDEFDEKRAKNLVERGLAEEIPEEETSKPKKKAPAKK